MDNRKHIVVALPAFMLRIVEELAREQRITRTEAIQEALAHHLKRSGSSRERLPQIGRFPGELLEFFIKSQSSSYPAN